MMITSPWLAFRAREKIALQGAMLFKGRYPRDALSCL